MILEDRSREESSEMLSRFGWKWAVMASTIGRMHVNNITIPSTLLQDLRLSRNKLESGCYSICESSCDLRDLETQIFPMLTVLGPQETDTFLELTGKALSGNINKSDIDLTGLQPIMSDCSTLPCVCH